MKIDLNVNYAIISTNINNSLLNKFSDYTIINDNVSYDELVNKIGNSTVRTVVFNDVLRKFKADDKKYIYNLLKLRNMNSINITSNIEEVVLSDYLIVYNNEEIVMEGNTIDILKEEKILKRLGFSLPFAVDLSKQLILYGLVDDVCDDTGKLVDKLWT